MGQLIRNKAERPQEYLVLSFATRQAWAARELLGRRNARTVLEETKENGAVTVMVVSLPDGSLAKLKRNKVFKMAEKADPADVSLALNLY